MLKIKDPIKALFIIPPFSDFYISKDRLYPINATIICKKLKQMGVNTNIVDLRFGSIERKRIPEKLSYLKKFYKKDYSKFSLFNTYNYYGICDKKNQQEFLEKYFQIAGVPDIFLVTSSFSAYRRFALMIIESILTFENIDSNIIIGGNDVAINEIWYKKKIKNLVDKNKFDNNKILIYSKFDLSEFEEYIQKLLDIKSNFIYDEYHKKEISDCSVHKKEINILGKLYSFYHLNKIICYNPIKKDIFLSNPVELYLKGSLILSYGCPYRCSYCFQSAINKQDFNYREVKDIFLDLLSLKEEGFTYIHIEDDSFTANKSKALKIIRLLILFNEKIYKFSYDFPNGINYHKIDEEIINLFERANIKRISISLGTADEEILKNCKRPSDKSQFLKFISYSKKSKISVLVYIIAGIPNQTFLEILNSFFFILENNLNLGFSPYYPVINSEDYIKYDFKNQLENHDNNDFFYASSSLASLNGCLYTEQKALLFKIYRILSYLINEKKKIPDYYNSMVLFFEKLVKENSIEISKFIEGKVEKFILIINHIDYKYINSFLIVLFMKTKNIYIISEKIEKDNKLILNLELFPFFCETEIFHEKFIDYLKK